MALLRASAKRLAAWNPFDSTIEQMTEQMLFRHLSRPSPAEQRSWARSIPALARDLADAGLGKAEVLLEQQLPLTSRRIDAIVAGTHPKSGRPSYVVVKLKQWSSAELFEGNSSLVLIDGYGRDPRINPLEQVAGYCQYLVDFTPVLDDQEGREAEPLAVLHRVSQATISRISGQLGWPKNRYRRAVTLRSLNPTSCAP